MTSVDFAFLDRRKPYDGRSLRSGPLGGVESGTAHLAEALARRGRRVAIYNDRPDYFDDEGVAYRPLKEAASVTGIAVANNDASLLSYAPRARRVVWAHNNVTLKTLREKGQFSSLLRFRPHIVFPSRFAAGRTAWFLPFRSRSIIEHGVDGLFSRFGPRASPPPPVAIFASQPRRNLKLVIEAWRTVVRPQLPDARLHVYHPDEKPKPKHLGGGLGGGEGVELKGSVGKEALAAAMREARAMIYPGHRTETFCCAASEATAAGLPLITMGVGALRERTRHDVDGFICGSVDEMGRRALDVLTDDALWRRLHEAAIADPASKSWDARAAQWEDAAERWR